MKPYALSDLKCRFAKRKNILEFIVETCYLGLTFYLSVGFVFVR